MELSTTREATSCAATQEPRNILWNPKVYYHIRKNPSLLRNLRHTDPYKKKIVWDQNSANETVTWSQTSLVSSAINIWCIRIRLRFKKSTVSNYIIIPRPVANIGRIKFLEISFLGPKSG
jgi:hypothetical protein